MSRARNILISSKGIPTRDPIADLMGQKLAAMSVPVVDITGNLPLSFTARAQQALRNYRLYGTSEGAGVETENLFDKDAKDTNNGYAANCYLLANGNTTPSANWSVSEYIAVDANAKYTLFSGTYSTQCVCFYNSSKTFIRSEAITTAQLVVTSPANAAFIRLSVRNTAAGTAMFLFGEYTVRPTYIPHGYKIPLTLASGQNADDYNLYIGSTELGEDEYVDYGEQKIYKIVEGVLTPTDPPSPLPAIQAYQGENTLSSSETVGNVTVKGRISEIPEP